MKTLQLGREFFQSVIPGVIKPLHILWNEIIGFLFLVIATFIVFGTLRRTAHDPDGFWPMVAGVGFGLILAGFGLSSFLRARKISRS